MKTELNGREVDEIELDNVDMKDYPKFCDAYISTACWADTGEELNDDELEELNSNSQLVYDLVQEYLY